MHVLAIIDKTDKIIKKTPIVSFFPSAGSAAHGQRKLTKIEQSVASQGGEKRKSPRDGTSVVGCTAGNERPEQSLVPSKGLVQSLHRSLLPCSPSLPPLAFLAPFQVQSHLKRLSDKGNRTGQERAPRTRKEERRCGWTSCWAKRKKVLSNARTNVGHN
jgi:hypothetical protein